MIYKIRTQKEVEALKGTLPSNVISEAERVTDILDEYYNSQGMDGGYILIAEDIADLNSVKNEYFDYTDMVYEFKDDIGGWISTLYIIGTEYSVTLIAPNQVSLSK